MASPPTITENSALFMAQQATLKRSQRRSPKLLQLLGALWPATKTRSSGDASPLAEKIAVAVPNIPPPKGMSADGKIITVVRTMRRP